MADTKIEWTKNADGTAGKSWNPIRARFKGNGKPGWYCQRISPGCAHCYAERRNIWIGNGAAYNAADLRTVDVYLDEKALLAPLGWKKPTTIFVCSMTDLFGSWVQEEWLDRIYAIEALCPQHTFIHLTKRPERRLKYLTALRDKGPTSGYVAIAFGRPARFFPSEFKRLPLNNDALWKWPLPNVRELVTVCNQNEADALIPILLETPAVCRGLSVEPMLGPVNLEHLPFGTKYVGPGARVPLRRVNALKHTPVLDWVICGGESGPGARPMNPDWARSLRDQCQAAGVPFFFKQWGEWYPAKRIEKIGNREKWEQELPQPGHAKPELHKWTGETGSIRVGKKYAGRLLDGKEWNEFPARECMTKQEAVSHV